MKEKKRKGKTRINKKASLGKKKKAKTIST